MTIRMVRRREPHSFLCCLRCHNHVQLTPLIVSLNSQVWAVVPDQSRTEACRTYSVTNRAMTTPTPRVPCVPGLLQPRQWNQTCWTCRRHQPFNKQRPCLLNSHLSLRRHLLDSNRTANLHRIHMITHSRDNHNSLRRRHRNFREDLPCNNKISIQEFHRHSSSNNSMELTHTCSSSNSIHRHNINSPMEVTSSFYEYGIKAIDAVVNFFAFYAGVCVLITSS